MTDLFLFIFFTSIGLIITLSIIYSALSVGISPMPSSQKAYSAMLALTEETGNGTIIDLGSGWGHFIIRAAKRYPKREVIGYEVSLLPWLISSLFKKAFKLENLTIHRKNFYKERLPNTSASVLVCYLFPMAMEKISLKLQNENHSITHVVSNNFALPLIQPHKVIQLNDIYKSPVYLYQVN